jgi:hypothetical protein
MPNRGAHVTSSLRTCHHRISGGAHVLPLSVVTYPRASRWRRRRTVCESPPDPGPFAALRAAEQAAATATIREAVADDYDGIERVCELAW